MLKKHYKTDSVYSKDKTFKTRCSWSCTNTSAFTNSLQLCNKAFVIKHSQVQFGSQAHWQRSVYSRNDIGFLGWPAVQVDLSCS
jgi:hypothetical protein